MPVFVDLHVHLLPGVDDGPATLEETVRLLAAAHAAGTRCLVATPHMFSPLFGNQDPGAIRRVFEECVEALARLARQPELEFLAELDLRLGAENALSPELLEAVEAGTALALAGSRYLLVELSPFLSVDTAVYGAERILARGLVPLIAHVERYPQLSGPELDRLLQLGCVAQINAGSLTGEGGRRLGKACLELLRTERARVVASDGHGADFRPPDLRPARDLVAAKLGRERALDCLHDAPARLLDSPPA